MPPRIPSAAVASSMFNLRSLFESLPQSINRNPESITKCSACLFSTSPAAQSIRSKKRNTTRKRVDPYRLAQANQRKAANLEKQKVLKEERQQGLGDPVRSRPTPFIESLTNPQASSASASASAASSSSAEATQYLNYLLTQSAASKQLEHSKWLTEPLSQSDGITATGGSASGTGSRSGQETEDVAQLRLRKEQHDQEHDNASRAIAAITALGNGSSKDRTRMNIQRCIETFGRHKTDQVLPSKPASLGRSATSSLVGNAEDETFAGEKQDLAQIPKRAGADTGSSEVQVAILTAKINVLASNLGKKDKNNKRNLRLLVHRRQKLLSYLRKKERGGPRWQHLIDNLGINDAMWKGEISL